MDEKLIQRLQSLNFNNIEAKTYIMLVKYNELNGSQIAKKINVSRSSVYSALNNLYNRGIIYLVPGNTNMYRAENPEILIEKIKTNFEENTKDLKNELMRIKSGSEESRYYNLSGTKNFINKAKELLALAKQEVYINTCLDLEIFREQIYMLAEKNVRVVVFTYSDINKGDLPIELYKHPLDNKSIRSNSEMRLMMVVDLKHTLICSNDCYNSEMSGTFTEDKLLANIVAEHIHHDIYILKLKEKEKGEIIKDDIKLNTILEGKASLDYK